MSTPRPPTGLTNQLIDLVKDLHAGAEWFRVVANADNEAAARAMVFAGVDPNTPAVGHVIINPPPYGFARFATDRAKGTWSVNWRLLLPPEDAADQPADTERACDFADAIISAVTKAAMLHPLVDGVVVTEPIFQNDESDALPDWYTVGLTMTGRCVP